MRAVGHFTHRHGKIDRLESLNEYWLATDARLRSEFNIPGLHAEGIDRVKRKSRDEAGVRARRACGSLAGASCAGAARRLRATSSRRSATRSSPSRTSASARRGPTGSRTTPTWTPSSATGRAIDYILEEYLEGQLLSFDGLVDRLGRGRVRLVPRLRR